MPVALRIELVDTADMTMTTIKPRAFSSEVDAGSRQENASKQESRAPFRFRRNGKGSGHHRLRSLTADQLTKSLEAQGIRAETMKTRLKADMVWTSLVRGRYKESLQVGERDVVAAAKEGGEGSQVEAFEYKMQPIVLLVPRGSPPAV